MAYSSAALAIAPARIPKAYKRGIVPEVYRIHRPQENDRKGLFNVY